ncbi:MAG: TIGR00725 family protein [Cyanobacteriota bacterium]|nr:TIGR00725 family protein [Cyanobacteriota bacterium]
MKKTIIGIMGPGSGASNADLENAYQLGRLIAEESWVLLTGGRKVGVMDAASRGAKAGNGLTIGILPDNNIDAVSEAVDIPIFTDMGNARNNINVLSSDVVIACGVGAGTLSEIGLAIKNKKNVILLNKNLASQAFLKSLSPERIYIVESPEEAIATTKNLL